MQIADWTSTELDRRSRQAALGVCGLVGLTGVWLLVKLLWLALPQSSPLDDAPFPSVPVEAAAPGVSLSKWHLFGSAGPSIDDLARSAPATQLQLTLRGTIAEADPHEGMAVIADATSGERAYRVGDTLPGGAVLESVFPDRVVLMHEGARETLALPYEQSSPGSSTPAPSASPVGASPGGARAAPPPALPPGSVAPIFVPPQMAQGAAADFSKIQQQLNLDPAALARQVNAQPVFENGRMTGVRLSGGPDAALVAQLGLQPNDVVTSINNVPLDSPARIQQVVGSVQNATRVTVTVNRDGKPVTLSVNLK